MSGKRARAFRAYQKVKTLKPSRSLFDLSHDVLFTGDMGKLYPICAMEMSPGDTFHIANESVVRMQPLNAPILHEISLTTHYFFVPYRILWEEWTDFITGGTEGEYGGTTRGEDVPSEIAPALPRWNPSNTAVGSLWDYLGFPTGVVPAGALPVDFIRRCYNRIWNEYYRDENLQEKVSEDNEEILYRNWRKDYFTSALESRQRGVAPALPVTGTVGVNEQQNTIKCVFSTSSDLSGSGSTATGTKTGTVTLPTGATNIIYSPTLISGPSGSSISVAYSLSGSTLTAVYTLTGMDNPNALGWLRSQYSSITQCDVNYYGLGITVDGSIGASVTDMRQVFQIQKWMELANRGGVRYTEFLRSFFGVSPRDDRLQRPEYIGGTKSPIIISEVLQTSATEGEPTPQGNMAGHGVGASRTYVGSYTAVEYGICMGLLSVMPTTKYQQGINRQWLRRTKFDFLFPQFTGLSEQAIEEAEIYATNNETENRSIFGFNEIYDELRAMPSKICGKMRTVFNYWHLARIFDSAPALNSDFIKCNPSKRIFAVPSEDGFIFNVSNIIRAVRPLPKYGTPKGV